MSRHVSQITKIRVWDIYNSSRIYGTCFICDTYIQFDDAYYMDWAHIVPFCAGGDSSVNNIRATCIGCNRLCRTKNLLKYYEEINNIIPMEIGIE